jgi:hypothetical protein
MANISTYLEELLLNHVFRNVDFPRPGATHYLAIFPDTAAEADLEASDFTDEIDTYAEADRPAITFDEAVPFQQAGKATLVSAGAVEYTVMPADTVGYAAVCTAAGHGAGNVLYWLPLTPARTPGAGNALRFNAGEIVIDLD